jgi:hypothetical protein
MLRAKIELKENEIIIGSKSLQEYFWSMGLIFAKSNKLVIRTTEMYSEKMFQLINIWKKIKCVEQLDIPTIRDEEIEVDGGTKKCRVYKLELVKVPSISGD